jgi:hypothetical protein
MRLSRPVPFGGRGANQEMVCMRLQRRSAHCSFRVQYRRQVRLHALELCRNKPLSPQTPSTERECVGSLSGEECSVDCFVHSAALPK